MTYIDLWPSEATGEIRVSDNGTGMTMDEFALRWGTLSYNRVEEQGETVAFPPGPQSSHVLLSANGKGRFSPFCFAEEYTVTTAKDGKCVTAEVRLTNGGPKPFDVPQRRVVFGS